MNYHLIATAITPLISSSTVGYSAPSISSCNEYLLTFSSKRGAIQPILSLPDIDIELNRLTQNL